MLGKIENEKEQENVENTEKDEKIDYNYEKKLKMSIGSFHDAQKFIQDNEYIKNGYILNCNTYKKAFLSLFICHNETVNIWSHLLGALIFVILIWYTKYYISNFKSQLINVKNDISLIEKKVNYLNSFGLNNTSSKVLNDINESINDMKNNLDGFYFKNLYENSMNQLSLVNNNTHKIISNNHTNINSTFKNNFTSFKKDLICLK